MGGGGGAGAGTDGYNPCPPAGEPCRVMPLGDSITQGKDGSSDEGGYRETLFRLAHAAGKSIQLVGSRTNGPATVDGVAWPRTHEGYSGYTIPALLRDDLTPNNVKTYKPNIVLLMIGTNDLSVGEAMPEVRLAGIVDTILSADPKLLLFLTQITPGQADKASYNQKVKPYNAAMVGIVSQRAAAGKHIRLMDMNTPFLSNANYSTALLANGVHPNDAGYKLMGQTWYAVLSPLLH
jgi:lysophospholipase L1-like esterase